MKICIELINKVKWYMERKDYNGLRVYIDEKEKYIEKCKIISRSKEEEYIDSLIKDLDMPNI